MSVEAGIGRLLTADELDLWPRGGVLRSGFLIDARWALTAWHCVRDIGGVAARLRLRLQPLDDGVPFVDVAVRYAAHDAELDVALLAVDQEQDGVGEAALPLGTTVPAYAPVRIGGFPERNYAPHAVMLGGTVESADARIGKHPAIRVHVPAFAAQYPETPAGMSGGPLLRANADKREEVVGVVVSYPRFGDDRGATGGSVICRRLTEICERFPDVAALPRSATAGPGVVVAGGIGARWRRELGRRGLTLWTDLLFDLGTGVVESVPGAPLEEHEIVDAAMLAARRLPGLHRDFVRLTGEFDTWITSGHRKRGAAGFRVLWLVGDPGPHRGRALLAAVSRARAAGRSVYDPGRDLQLAADTVMELAVDDQVARPALIPVNLPDHQPSAGWTALMKALDGVRRFENPDLPGGPPDVTFVIAGTAGQEQVAYEILQSAIEISPVDLTGRPHQRPNSFAGAETLASRSVSAEHIFNRGLPKTAPQLFGRHRDLERLHDAWRDPEAHVVTLVAAGGVGKSSLVNHWLRELRAEDYRGAERILAWSFYSQGTTDNWVSADVFIDHALTWLGDDGERPNSPAEQGARLAGLLRRHRTLLVLDGLEPLQHPESAPDIGGTLTDISIASLLSELAAPGWEGLCLITTRLELAGVTAGPGAIRQMELENLDIDAGVQLLESLIGLQRDAAAAADAVETMHGHALAINLLGRYLRDVHGGQLTGRFEPVRLTDAVADGGHAQRIMDLYTTWLDEGERRGELAILDTVGLFDRPAPLAAIAAVLTDTGLAAEPGLADLDGDTWHEYVARLRRMGLLAGDTAGLPGTLDAHPLVREHFRDRLRERQPELWIAGNRALYDYYRCRAPELPTTPADMNLLYSAVNHGCAIGLHQEVYQDILEPRIWRGARMSYSTRILGMTGSEIGALSNYFRHRGWGTLREVGLTGQAQTLIRSNAALRLRQIGQPDAARASCGAVFDSLNTPDGAPQTPAELRDAVFASCLLAELLIIAGWIEETDPDTGRSAMEVTGRAIQWADASGDAYFRMYARSCRAEVHFMRGAVGIARDLFAAAEEIGADGRADPPFLYSQNLYRYGFFAIETGVGQTLLTGDAHNERWGVATDKPSQLSFAIRSVVLSAARRAAVEAGGDRTALRQAAIDLDAAVGTLRGIGYTDYTVRGLLERAHLRRVSSEPPSRDGALADLEEALAESRRLRMRLLTADVLLERIAWRLAAPSEREPEHWEAHRAMLAADLAEASTLLRRIGYDRRRELYAQLEAAAALQGVVT